MSEPAQNNGMPLWLSRAAAQGGPISALSGLILKFLGVESAPIIFDRSGARWSVKASSLVDMAAEAPKRSTPALLSLSTWKIRGIQPLIASHWPAHR